MTIGFAYPHQQPPTAEVSAAIATTVEMLRLHALLTDEPLTDEVVERAIDLLFAQARPHAVNAAKHQLGL